MNKEEAKQMIVRETIANNRVRVYSDAGKKIVDTRNGNEYSEAVIKATAKVTFVEKEEA